MRCWLLLGICAPLCAACSSTLETGYTPEKLGMTPSVRRALYVDPYSQQAQEAKDDQMNTARARRPTAY